MIQDPTQPASGLPSRIRTRVTAYALLIAVIMYLDRVCIAQAAPLISADLGLTRVQMGWAFAAFNWAYAIFEVPGGWLGDRIGPRRVLTRVVLWWSFFTAATGWVWNAPSLIVTRALFGAGEAGCFPNLTRIFTTWLPVAARERVQGLLWFCARWSGAFTPLLVAYILEFMTWRIAFVLFALPGVIWSIFFYRFYRDDPRTHPDINAGRTGAAAARRQTRPSVAHVPWGRLLRNTSVLLLCLQYAFLSYGWYFYVTWLPTYLREARGTSVKFGALAGGAAAAARRHRLPRRRAAHPARGARDSAA